VGANEGAFAREAWGVFGAGAAAAGGGGGGGGNGSAAAAAPPRVLMFEGAAARAPSLEATGFEYVISVMGARARWVDWIASDLAHTGNSVLREQTRHFAALPAARVPMRRVDDLLAAALGGGAPARGSVLLKLDVQGYEVQVLRGAAAALGAAELVLLEAGVLPYNAGAPLLAELLCFMHAQGFAVLDLVELHHAGAAQQLLQVDFTFVRRSSPLFAAATAAGDVLAQPQ